MGNQTKPEQFEYTDRVVLGQDGKYHWVYEMNLFKNPTVFVTVWAIFFCILVGIFAVVTIVDVAKWEDKAVRALNDLKYFGIAIGGMTGLVALGYLIYAAMMGGKYIVEFDMDEKGVTHRQTPAQAKKAQKLGRAAAMGGVATGRFSTIGVGASAQRTEMYTQFDKVKKVKVHALLHVIKVNEPLNHNQVYAKAEDFDFVKGYILSHCTLVAGGGKHRDSENVGKE